MPNVTQAPLFSLWGQRVDWSFLTIFTFIFLLNKYVYLALLDVFFQYNLTCVILQVFIYFDMEYEHTGPKIGRKIIRVRKVAICIVGFI